MTRPGAAVTWGMARPRIRFGTLPMVVLVAVAVFCASCGGSPSATGDSSTTSSVRSTTTSTNAQASGVLAAYRAVAGRIRPSDPARRPDISRACPDDDRSSSSTRSDGPSSPIRRTGSWDEGTVQLNPKVGMVTRQRQASFSTASSTRPNWSTPPRGSPFHQ